MRFSVRRVCSPQWNLSIGNRGKWSIIRELWGKLRRKFSAVQTVCQKQLLISVFLQVDRVAFDPSHLRLDGIRVRQSLTSRSQGHLHLQKTPLPLRKSYPATTVVRKPMLYRAEERVLSASSSREG